MKQIGIIIVLCFIGQGLLFGQGGKIKRANQYFEDFSFINAIAAYEDVVANGVKEPTVLRNLAQSYVNVREFKRAEATYETLVHGGLAEDVDIWNYSQTLKSNGKYEESNRWVEKYLEMNENDPRAKDHVMKANYFEELKKDADRIKIYSLNINTAYSEFGTTYYGDLIVFASSKIQKGATSRAHSWDNEPFLDLYSAKIVEDGELENVSRLQGDVNTKFHEGVSTFSPDGQKMIFTRNNYFDSKVERTVDGVNNLKIFTAQKEDDGSWGNIQSFPYNSSEFSVGHPTLTSDGKTMYFVSDMPGGFGGTDIYKSNYVNGTWSKPENLGQTINTKGAEMFPYLHANGTLYFSSDGLLNLGGLDIFSSWYSEDGWNNTRNLGFPINGPSDDFAFILNEFGNEGYFSSNRDGGKGSDDIYRFTIDPNKSRTLKGLIVDYDTGQPLADARVVLYNEYHSKMDEFQVGSKGEFIFYPDVDLCNYYIVASNGDKYTRYRGDGLSCKEQRMFIDEGIIPLKVMEYGIVGAIKDKGTNLPIEEFNITLINRDSKEVVAQFRTDNKGQLEERLEAKTNYKIVFEKEGWMSKEHEFTTIGMEPGVINVEERLDLSFSKFEIGTTIEIENIYYDYNKANIRSDAAFELDKIVVMLYQYPNMEIELGSHTDSRGGDDYNLDLSDQRAKAAADYIIRKGIEPSRVVGRGYGESKLRNQCTNDVICSEEDHQRNRRTEFTILTL